MVVSSNVYFLFMLFSLCYGEVQYMAIFEDGFKSCEDFDNNFVDCTGLVLDTASASEACIEGAVDLFKAVDNQKIVIEIYKKGDYADEFMFTMDGDICEHICDDKAPWYEFFASMNITSCPILEGNYLSKKMTIDIGDAQKVLNHELCGAYLIRNKVLDKDTDDVLACYDLSIRVIEVES